MKVARCCHTLLAFNRRIFAIGGIGKKSKFLKSVESFDLDEMEWRVKAPM